jgi:hypothetical protein
MKGKNTKIKLKKNTSILWVYDYIITQFILKGLLNFFEYKLRLKNTVSNF